jgi:DNA-binding NtrC family response regulator
MDLRDLGVLIVDDEHAVRDSLRRWFTSYGCRIDVAADGTEALAKLARGKWDIVLLDIRMPGMDGLELQRRIREIDESVIRIMITAFASAETAVEALKEGAFDYISKPVNLAQLDLVVRNAAEKRRLLAETAALRQTVEELATPEEIIGETPEFRRVLELVGEVARSEATVMIRGESGTGKELVARAIHANSPRKYHPIVCINCGAYTDGLLESEIFGHEKGAFTGAQALRRGKLELANKGTLFFDEIGNIGVKMQVDLLRALETKQFTRLGGERIVTTDFRVISATNMDLERAVRDGRFREDLYYRLNVFHIEIPPLRARQADIPRLAEYFLAKFRRSMGKASVGFAPEAVKLLTEYRWPGNVRELRNVVERAMVVAKGTVVAAADLSLPFSEACGPEIDSLEENEKLHIARVLHKTKGSVTRAAERLGVERATLYAKIKKYGLRD